MNASFEVRNDIPQRTIYTRLSGIFREEDMRAWAKLYREKGTAPYRGKKHMVIADMRGMKPSQIQVAAIMGEEIGYGRQHGAVLCAHISDHVVQQLQAARCARENSPDDDVTVNVATIEEAYKVLAEARGRLDDRRYSVSVRDDVLP